ncbi:hypothetical protein [Wolbachia endosymbiont (group B) of Eucosma cana]|uniref:hypothetical protein n=1 Tax=Wolbachia endosymbiont (group B) of Eucosma cana TaxID=2954012 RepID=UPI0022277F78|nr:hypothetical protein [Wolbachia endosymbiont (group B) of Eucosma cana]
MKYEDIRMMTDEEFERTTNMTDEEFDEMSNEKFDSWIYTTNKRLMKDLNEINSANDLVLSLKFATLNKDVAYIKQAVSKFKSSKNGQFGDYINRSGLLFFAVSHRDIELTEFLLKKGVDPNTEISELFLRNDKIKKLLIEYGRYDKSSVLGQFALAVLAGSMAFAIYSSCDASFLCYARVAAFALAGVFLVANAIHDVFYAQTKWPSPDFDEVSTEKVVTNVELNAEGNSRESGNALA